MGIHFFPRKRTFLISEKFTAELAEVKMASSL